MIGASRVIDILKSIERAWTQIARRRCLSCVLIVALALIVRLAILPVDPKPEPRYHDEFAYIFGGETLAMGRLANPTPPLWRFFETYYINMQPTYVSKYPPAQSAFLALGIRLLGHPWYGVLISIALMCGCICWMLQGWLPPKYALLWWTRGPFSVWLRPAVALPLAAVMLSTVGAVAFYNLKTTASPTTLAYFVNWDTYLCRIVAELLVAEEIALHVISPRSIPVLSMLWSIGWHDPECGSQTATRAGPLRWRPHRLRQNPIQWP